jgi:uncharacterized protein involved in exopolysaccharide biosynthesis
MRNVLLVSMVVVLVGAAAAIAAEPIYEVELLEIVK